MIPKEIQERLIFKNFNTEHPELPRLMEIKYDLKPCEDCGKRIGRREIHSTLAQTPYPHWKHECKNCHCYKNPQTKQYDIDNPYDFAKLLKQFKNNQ